MQWLSEPACKATEVFGQWLPVGLPDHPTRLQLLACFIKMDGGGWGVHQGGGIYGSTGLDQGQAMLALELRSFVRGWLLGGDAIEEEQFQLALDAEWQRVRALSAQDPEP